ncbi:MAG TPA: phage portal protein, partial [Devosia sp.]|nr:phage portal protein [Devosia sp.]
IPWTLYQGEKEIENHPILDLLNAPNPLSDGAALLEAWYSHIRLSGNGYLEAVDGLGGRAVELYVHRPERMKVVPGPDGWPMAYDYTVGGLTKRFPVDFDRPDNPILHVRAFHPLDDWYGMSPLDPAAWSIDTHTGAGSYSTALLRNSATPSGALVMMPDKDGRAGSLDDTQFKRLKEELESAYQGARNAGKPMVLEGGLDWRQFGMTMDQLQFIETKRDAAREIATAFGVPPMLLGIPGDNTFANYQEANRTLWRQTIIPTAMRGARALTNWLGPRYGKGLVLKPNIDDLDALAEERQIQWDRIEKDTTLTINEKRIAKGYTAVDGGDVILVSSSMIPLEDAGATISGSAEPPDDETDDTTDDTKPKPKPKPKDNADK